MNKDTYIPITETDVKDPNLLFRLLGKLVQRITGLSGRISTLETAPRPLTPQELSANLQAGGSAPLTVTALPGNLSQPQPASAPVYTVAPSGLPLQQLGDTQLIVVGTTSTGMVLQTVKGGNPNTLINLSSALVVGGNFMTLDTVQTSTGAKTLQGLWTFSTNALINNWQVGSWGPSTAYAFIGTNALDQTVVSNYAMLQSTAGVTFLNASTGGSINFRIGNVTQAFVTTSSFGITPNVYLNNVIAQYHGLNTAGEGVPYILARSEQDSLSTSPAAATSLYTATSSGEYRASYYITISATGVSGSCVLLFNWNDRVGLQGFQSAGSTFTSVNNVQGTITAHLAATQHIQYQPLITSSTAAPVGAATVYIVLERLS